jgi:hypothetical protein
MPRKRSPSYWGGSARHEPSGGHRARYKGDDPPSERTNQLALASREIRLHSEHGRREDQHEHVVDRVADIDEADDAAQCRYTPPLDVAPERALLGSSDRLCPDTDHRRKS